MQKILLLFSFLFVIQISFGQNKNDTAKNVELIKAARQISNDAIAKHNIDEISKFWHDDFVQVRGNSTYLSGKDTIIASWKKLFESNPNVKYVRTPSQIIISTNDTLAWETGTWKAFNSYSNGGNYSAMWRKSKGIWKIQAELFVSLF